MVGSVTNNGANIGAVVKPQSSALDSLRNAARSSPIAAPGKAAKSTSPITIQAGASPTQNLPRGSIVDRLV